MLIRHRHKRVTPDLELIKFSRHLRHGEGKEDGTEQEQQIKKGVGKYLFESLLGVLLEVIVSVGKSVQS